MSEEALFLYFWGMEPCPSFFYIIKVVINIHLMLMRVCFIKVNTCCAHSIVLIKKIPYTTHA
jgi:hypothetical protein